MNSINTIGWKGSYKGIYKIHIILINLIKLFKLFLE
jgi:hypothetical protein